MYVLEGAATGLVPLSLQKQKLPQHAIQFPFGAIHAYDSAIYFRLLDCHYGPFGEWPRPLRLR